jgi:phenylpropionate dioxygenase-like ring-hydroxylating dioxygenase large terminal subunit
VNPNYYFDQKIFDRELEKIFNKSSFVCEADFLGGKDSYYSYLNFGRPTTARKQGEEYKLIENICLHRSNVIDPLGQGNREFKCNYHGWKYANDGELSRAPMVELGCINKRVLKSVGLKNYKELLFVDEVGGVAEEIGLLDSLEYHDCGTFYRSELLHDCNWKLLIENVVESYHISFAHPESFVPTGITSTSATANKYKGRSSFFEIQNKAINIAVDQYSKNYRHAHIYPNLFLSVSAGLVGFMSYVVPVSPDKTVLKWRLFETQEMLKLKSSVRKILQKNSIEFTTRVLNEDLMLLNSSQVGLRYSRNEFQLQSFEERISHFHSAYLSEMELV